MHIENVEKNSHKPDHEIEPKTALLGHFINKTWSYNWCLESVHRCLAQVMKMNSPKCVGCSPFGFALNYPKNELLVVKNSC